ncbi:MAG: DUF5723 family protein [Crocinitomicaceae bacterium]
MKKLIPLYTMLLLAPVVFGQEMLSVYETPDEDKNVLSIQSMNYYASNRFNNDLTDKFIFGGTITTEIKERAFDKMSNLNALGGQAEQEILFYTPSISPIGDERYGLVVGLSDHHLLSSHTPTDLFQTLMYGNVGTLGDTMDFGFTHVQYLHYQKVGIGLYEKSTLSSIRLNYVIGSRAFEGRLSNSWMVSQTDAIALNLRGSGYQTDRFNPYISLQGSGASIDLNYNFKFETKTGREQILNLQVNNLGFIYWNQSTISHSVDSLVQYTGFDVQDFINQPEGAENNYNFQDTLGIESTRGNVFKALPIEFAIQKLPMRESDKKLQIIGGFKTILTSDYFPYFYGGAYYSFSESFTGSTRLSYGGFGQLQWGLNLNYWGGDKARISLGTFDMLGFISKTYGHGRSINLSANIKL